MVILIIIITIISIIRARSVENLARLEKSKVSRIILGPKLAARFPHLDGQAIDCFHHRGTKTPLGATGR
eukprot:2986116-Karenia_brevis.AAC.1